MAKVNAENLERLEVAQKIKNELERLGTIAAAGGWSSVALLISIASTEADRQIAISSPIVSHGAG
ncbi:MAG: hypothetical protein AAAB35_01815 [Phyllobacterium sp.]|uniref:hypothetical protein n=1 Tax=Phyllobacterium sp. TaxID=1871046 RepID=UPI0030F2BB62